MSQIEAGQIRVVSFVFPGEVPAEIAGQFDEFTVAGRGAGAQVYDRFVKKENGEVRGINLFSDEGLGQASKCLAHMGAFGLLDPDKEIRNLGIGDPPEQQQLWAARGFKGTNRKVVSCLAHTIMDGEHIDTVPQLLRVGVSSLMKRSIGPKELGLLRQALVDSGMPPEFPWPYARSEHLTDSGQLLRAAALFTPTFAELPLTTQKELATSFGIVVEPNWGHDGRPPAAELAQCEEIYGAERKRLLQIVAGQSQI